MGYIDFSNAVLELIPQSNCFQFITSTSYMGLGAHGGANYLPVFTLNAGSNIYTSTFSNFTAISESNNSTQTLAIDGWRVVRTGRIKSTISGGNHFYLCANNQGDNATKGYAIWKVSNIIFAPNDTFSFQLELKVGNIMQVSISNT